MQVISAGHLKQMNKNDKIKLPYLDTTATVYKCRTTTTTTTKQSNI